MKKVSPILFGAKQNIRVKVWVNYFKMNITLFVLAANIGPMTENMWRVGENALYDLSYNTISDL